MSDGLSRTILGTSRSPRYGSAWSVAVLAGIGVLFALLGWWALAIICFVLAAGALFVLGVRRSTSR